MSPLDTLSERFGETVVDPSCWPDLLDDLCRGIDASGALLLQAHNRSSGVPVTRSISDAIDCYFRDKWHERDVRARAVPLQRRGKVVVVDDDIVSREERLRSDYYNDLARKHDIPWFASLAIYNEGKLWGGLSFLRSSRQGPFSETEQQVLTRLVPRLTEAADLATAVGRGSLVGILDALKLVAQPAMALGCSGQVIDVNASMERLFNQDVFLRARRLVIKDPSARAAYEGLAERLRTSSDADTLETQGFLIPRSDTSLLSFRVLPICGPARGPFLGARALLVATDLLNSRELADGILKQHFGLTPSEERLARCLARGTSLRQSAVAMRIAPDTARNHLKSIFAKTGTNRQGELVALLGRF